MPGLVSKLVPGAAISSVCAVITGRSGPKNMNKARWSGSLTVITLKDQEKDSVNLAVWSNNEQVHNSAINGVIRTIY